MPSCIRDEISLHAASVSPSFPSTLSYARKRNGLLAMVLLRAMQFPALGWTTAAILSGPIAAGDAHGTLLGAAGLLLRSCARR